MSRNLLSLSVVATLLGGAAQADIPRVVADIAPVHSLVARVMEGIAEPSLIVTQGASPHEYSLRPSEARALQNADLVFWVSPDLTPWLGSAIETLTRDAKAIELLETDTTMELPLREGALFETHIHGDADKEDDHGPEEHGHDDHGHKEHGHDDHGHDDHGHDDHHEDEHSEDEHGHGDHDPHAWLSPENGAAWLDTIAAQLAAIDPENALAYQANAAEGRAELAALSAEISGILDPVRGRNFIVFHDAYQYFEVAFDFPAGGAISVSDAKEPSPARIAEIRARVKDQNVTCVLSEPQFNQGLVASVLDGSDARTGVMDPLGAELEPGAALYGQVLRNMATVLSDCLQ